MFKPVYTTTLSTCLSRGLICVPIIHLLTQTLVSLYKIIPEEAEQIYEEQILLPYCALKKVVVGAGVLHFICLMEEKLVMLDIKVGPYAR